MSRQQLACDCGTCDVCCGAPGLPARPDDVDGFDLECPACGDRGFACRFHAWLAELAELADP